jgi:diketogulonate reductase-like aldo/keto reductase
VPKLIEIGMKYGKTPVQVTLRWDLQKGVITIPKSVRKERIISNANIFDFSLTDEEIKIIDSLNKNERMGADPDNFNF